MARKQTDDPRSKLFRKMRKAEEEENCLKENQLFEKNY